jgi:anion-transporting  ArsA/GET3 family ATPase
MSVERVVGASGVLIVAGKGGVGKTTVGATVALAAARAGAKVHLIELEGQSQLASLFGAAPARFDPSLLWRSTGGAGEIWGRRITPDEALLDYLGSHGLDRITGRLASTGIIDVVTTAAVGLRDLMALGKIRQIADRREGDLVVVDGPAAGHATSFLRTPFGLARASLGGPVHSQAMAALEFLSDEARCRVQLVCVPEVTPVTECIDTAYVLEDEVGVALAPVVVNQVVEPLKGLISAARSAKLPAKTQTVVDSRIRRSRIQTTQLTRLGEGLPLEQIHLPQLLTAWLSPDHIHQLADAYA